MLKLHANTWLRENGWRQILQIHDEVVCEILESSEFPTEEFVDELCLILENAPPWAQGIPIVAEGFHCYRFTKGD